MRLGRCGVSEFGLLWWDDGDLEGAVCRAAAAYRKRFGQEPNVCEVHPDALGGEIVVEGIVVRLKAGTLKQHYFMKHEERRARPHQATLFKETS